MAACDVNGFNYSEFHEKDSDNRDGRFLFDTLFGLELEEELINAADATNSLKSCDCGKSKCVGALILTNCQVPQKFLPPLFVDRQEEI